MFLWFPKLGRIISISSRSEIHSGQKGLKAFEINHVSLHHILWGHDENDVYTLNNMVLSIYSKVPATNIFYKMYGE